MRRREFLKVLGFTIASTFVSGYTYSAERIIEIKQEASIVPGLLIPDFHAPSAVAVGDRILMVLGKLAVWSEDGGKTWPSPTVLMGIDGSPMDSTRSVASLINFGDGEIGLFGKQDDEIVFFKSTDAGKSWMKVSVVNSVDSKYPQDTFAHFLNDTGSILKSGRILVPAFNWGIKAKIPASWDYHSFEGIDFCYSFVFYSDDRGLTWKRSNGIFTYVDRGFGGAFTFEEPSSIVELKDGRLMMFGRTNLGQLFKTFSNDGGISWYYPEPTGLTSDYAPCKLTRIPNTGDLLVIWNQCSPEEQKLGLGRHRLSCAISKDDGKTWQHHKNFESLDDVSFIKPPPISERAVFRAKEYKQPDDRKRYYRAPGPLRCAYPACTFYKGNAIVSYDFGCQNDMIGKVMLKVRTIPVTWFYS